MDVRPSSPNTLSIIIPVYNEERTIVSLISKVKSVVLPDNIAKQIIIVNDGSTDQTVAFIVPLIKNSSIELYHHEDNKGKTAAVRLGLSKVRGDMIIIQDADLEYDPEQYPLLLKPMIAHDYPIVYGSRFKGTVKNMRIDNWFANKISNFTINILFGARMTDFHSCFKLFKRQTLDDIVIRSERFSFDTELTCKFLRKGYIIHEVPIQYKARTRAEGKKITWMTALRSYWILLKCRFFAD